MGVEILRVIPLGVNGKPALCDELKIVDRSGRCYGALVQKVGYKEWFYYYNLGEIYSRTGTKITGNKFEILGVHGHYYENKDQVYFLLRLLLIGNGSALNVLVRSSILNHLHHKLHCKRF